MNYKVLKNGELLRVHSCKVYPKPYNSTEHMEYVMFNVDDREEIVIESETEIKSAVIRPLSAGISGDRKAGAGQYAGDSCCIGPSGSRLHGTGRRTLPAAGIL